MPPPRFAFRHTWSVAAPPAPVYDVLAGLGEYPLWWPQVRAVARLGDEAAAARIRSVLPYTLDLVLVREVEDPERGLLRVAIEGDLDGYAEWTLAHESGRTVATFAQEVLVARPVLARAARVGGGALRLNHAWMMSRGERGLVRHLAGFPAG